MNYKKINPHKTERQGKDRIFTFIVESEMLLNGVEMACHEGFKGEVYVIPHDHPSTPTTAIGSLKFKVNFHDIDEEIQNGTVDLSKTNPSTYLKPNWSGPAHSVSAIGSVSCKLVKIIIARWS